MGRSRPAAGSVPAGAAFSRRPRTPFLRRPIIEELEARLLLSADPTPQALIGDAVFATPLAAEFRAITDVGAPKIEFAAAAPEAVHRTREIVFVDASTPDFKRLLDDIRANATETRDIEVVALYGGGDGIEQITNVLAKRTGIDAIHVISHGSPGEVQLGAATLDFDSLVKQSKDIKKWGKALGENGDILFYGCDLAANESGKSLMEAISRLTGADVAASEDLTGAAALGGDWDLEFKVGFVESALAVSLARQSSYEYVLAPGITVSSQAGADFAFESGADALIQVVLNEAPTANVTIAVSSSNPGQMTVSTSSLTFTTANWNVAQVITASATNDATAEGEQNYTVVLAPAVSADAGYNGINPADVTITVIDDDDVRAGASDLISLYLFDETSGTTVLDKANNGTPLNLTMNTAEGSGWNRTTAGAIQVTGNNIIAQSAAGPHKIYSQIVAAQEFTVEAWVQSSTLTQPDSVPHRLVTLSADTGNRNFTLAVSDGDETPANAYFGRVRGGAGDLGGTVNEFTTGANSADLGLTHVVLTVDTAGNRRIYVDGTLAGFVNAPVNYASWNSAYRFALFNELTLDRDWLGAMHLAAIYDRALSAAEVQRNFAAGANENTLIVDTAADYTIASPSWGDTSSIGALLQDKGADGFISLREAITAVNNTALVGGQPHRIFFNIPGAATSGAPHAITLASALPTIDRAVILDGWSEPDFNGTPIIVIDGEGYGSLTLGANADGSTIRGFVIRDMGGAGVDILSGSINHVIAGNYIGSLTAAGGDAGAGERNGQQGISVWSSGNIIGGYTAVDRNVIAGNVADGIQLIGASATGNRVVGNYIGVDATGRNALGNGQEGVQIIIDASGNFIGEAGAGNVIGANANPGVGINTNADNNRVQGNWIGTNPWGDALGNGYGGIDIVVGSDNNLIGGTNAGEGNVIAFNLASGGPGLGVGVNPAGTPGTGNRILGNSIYGNAGLGIDIGTIGVTANDGVKTVGAANQLMDSPVFTSVSLVGNTLTVAGHVGSAANQATFANSRVEIFKAAADPSGYGEGRVFLGFLTANASGNFSGSIDVTGKGFVLGDTLTGTATDTLNNTSEFGENFTTTALATLSGRVLEDVNGDANLADAVGVNGVDVRIYLDDGSGTPDGADTLVATGVTANIAGLDGSYSIGVAANGTYWVVVDSRDIAPSAGLNGAGFVDDVWADQTYAVANGTTIAAVGWDGSFTVTGTSGAFYGGLRGDRSDDGATLNAAAAVGAEHIQRVIVSGGTSVSGVDSAFSFNVVTTTRGGDATDDAAGQDRSVQGSLRQFIQNANGITGANAMRFVPVGNPNQVTGVVGGGDDWWRITVSNALPVITDAGTTIDGTAYDYLNPAALRDTNTGTLGYVGAVGLGADATGGTGDEITLSGVEKPELEIVEGGAAVINQGLDVQASNVTIRRIAISGFGNEDPNTAPLFTQADIRVGQDLGGDTGPAYTNVVIEDNVIGIGPGAIANPGFPNQSVTGIAVFGPDNGTIQRNLVAYAGRFGIFLSNGANGWTVTRNDVRENAYSNTNQDAVDSGNLSTGTVVTGNYVYNNWGGGFDSYRGAGSYSITDNTFLNNGRGASEPASIRLYGTNSTVSRNLIQNSGAGVNPGPGVLVVQDDGITNTPATGNRISKNSFLANGGISIDLAGASSSNSLGDGVGFLGGTVGAGNAGLSSPTISAATITGTTLTISGTAAANATVEIYRAVAGSGDGAAPGYGEGNRYLGTATASATGAWTFTVTTTAVALNDYVSAIAITAAGNTSEFALNRQVTAGVAPTGPVTDIARTSGVVVDGTVDGAWASAATNSITTLSWGAAPANAADLSGSWRALWDDNYLYVLVNVQDATLKSPDGGSGNPDDPFAVYEDDVVEVFIDGNYSRTTLWDGSDNYDEFDDYQWGFRWRPVQPDGGDIGKGTHSATPGGFTPVSSMPGISFKMVPAAGGYVLEAAFAWSMLKVTPTAGLNIGIDVQLGDDDDAGAGRDSKLAWSDPSDSAWFNPGFLGTGRLTATTANTAPVAVADSYVVNEDATLTIPGGGWDATMSAWAYRSQLTIGNIAAGTQTDFPLLVQIDTTRFGANFYSQAKAGGADLRFLDPDGTLLDYEIESWNPGGISYAWVRVPQLDAASGTDFIRMYWGNAAAIDAQNANGVWNPAYVGVWHLNGGATDSSGTGNNGVDSGTSAATGKIGGGRDFDGVGDYISVADNASLQLVGSSYTLEGWVWIDTNNAATDLEAIIRKGLGNPNDYQLAVRAWNGALTPSPAGALLVTEGSDDGGLWASGTTPTGGWRYVVGTLNGVNRAVYVDGVLVASDALGTAVTAPTTGNLFIGGRSDGEDMTDGRLDEVRISNTARSANWIRAQYASMNGALLTAGVAQGRPAAGVLANDTDPNGDVLTAVLNTGPAHGSLTLNPDGSFTYTPNADYYGSDSFTYRAFDGSLYSAVQTVTITVNAVADIVADSVSTAEDTALVFNPITGTGGASADSFEASPLITAINGSAIVSGGPAVAVGNGTVSLTGTGTLSFTPTANYNGATSFTYTVTSGGVTETETVNVTVTAVNDAPTATNLSAPETYTEDTALNLTDIVVSDVDSANVTVTLTLSDLAAGSLNTATAGSVTSTFAAGVWTAAGAIADVNTLLAGLTFTPALNYNSNFSIATSVSDGVAPALTGSKSMTGIAVNDAPTATNLSAPETYTEDTALNLTDIVVSDVDSANVTVTLTLSDLAAGSLNTATAGSVTSTFAAGVWTAAGAIADVNTLLAGLTFTPALNYNSNFSIATSVSDGVAPALTGSKSMTGIAVNDAPTLAIPPAQIVAEDTPLALTGPNAVTVADLDAAVLQVTLTAANGVLALAGTTGLAFSTGDGTGDASMTFSGSAAAINAALDGMEFLPDLNYVGAASVSVLVEDLGQTGAGGPLSASGTIAIAVGDVNDAPVITAPGGQSVAEDALLVFSAGNGNAISIADADAGTSPVRLTLNVTNGTLTLAGTTGLAFLAGDGVNDATLVFTGTLADINAALSALVFRGTADYHGPASLQVVTDDLGASGTGGALSATSTIAINVTPVNDAPALVSNTLTLRQGETVVLGVGNLAATDIDDAAASLVFDVEDLVNGRFERAGAAGIAISQFTQGEVEAGLIRFVHTGAEAPSYRIRVNDLSLSDGPRAATIVYAAAPGTGPDTGGGGTSGPGPVTEPPTSVPPPSVTPPSVAPAPAQDFLRAPTVPPLDEPGPEPAPQARETSAEAPKQQAVAAFEQKELAAGGDARNERIPVPDQGIEIDEVVPVASVPLRKDAVEIFSRAAVLEMPEDGQERRLEIVLDSVKISGLALSVGAVWWALRATGLVASLLASAPAWRHIDPLPVLGRGDEEEEADVEWGDAEDADERRDEQAASWVLEDRSTVTGDVR